MGFFEHTRLAEKKGLRRYIGPKRVVIFLVFACCALYAWQLWKQGNLAPERIFAFISSYPVLSPLLFVLVYGLLIFFIIPSLPLNLGAGLLWGPFYGSLLALLGSVLGSAASFLLARTALGQPLARRWQNALLRGVQEEMETRSWRVVAFMCVNPAIPLGPQNLLLGLTSLRFRTFLWATAAFLYPPVLAFTIIGHATGGFILQGGVEKAFRLVIWVSLAVTLLVVGRIAVRRASGRGPGERG